LAVDPPAVVVPPVDVGNPPTAPVPFVPPTIRLPLFTMTAVWLAVLHAEFPLV
jgi:hypothetical protein